jgi:hypothetical protein
MTIMRNDSVDDLARLDVANLYCEMHFQLLIPTWQHFDSWFKIKMDCSFIRYLDAWRQTADVTNTYNKS